VLIAVWLVKSLPLDVVRGGHCRRVLHGRDAHPIRVRRSPGASGGERGQSGLASRFAHVRFLRELEGRFQGIKDAGITSALGAARDMARLLLQQAERIRTSR